VKSVWLIAKCWTVRWFEARQGAKNILFSKTLKFPHRLWDPPRLILNGYKDTLPRRKGGGGERKVDHSLPSSAEVKNEWSYTSTTPICLHGANREKFTFNFRFPQRS
jgi:hypothetical protein